MFLLPDEFIPPLKDLVYPVSSCGTGKYPEIFNPAVGFPERYLFHEFKTLGVQVLYRNVL